MLIWDVKYTALIMKNTLKIYIKKTTRILLYGDTENK